MIYRLDMSVSEDVTAGGTLKRNRADKVKYAASFKMVILTIKFTVLHKSNTYNNKFANNIS